MATKRRWALARCVTLLSAIYRSTYILLVVVVVCAPTVNLCSSSEAVQFESCSGTPLAANKSQQLRTAVAQPGNDTYIQEHLAYYNHFHLSDPSASVIQTRLLSDTTVGDGDGRFRVSVGRDPRLSGEELSEVKYGHLNI